MKRPSSSWQAPAQVVIPMSMHFGAPCTPDGLQGRLCQAWTEDRRDSTVSALPFTQAFPVRSLAVEPRPYSMGGKVMSVVIDNDFKDDLSEEVQAPGRPRRAERGGNGRNGQAGRYRRHGRRNVPHPHEDLQRHRQGRYRHHQRRGVRALHHRRPPRDAGAARARSSAACSYLAKMFGVSKVVIGVEDNKQNGIDALNKAHRRAEGSRRGRVAALPLPPGR